MFTVEVERRDDPAVPPRQVLADTFESGRAGKVRGRQAALRL